MFQQDLEKTFIGTSSPVVFKHSLSYFGPDAPDTSDFSVVFHDTLIDHYVDSHVGTSCRIKLDYTLESGLSLPAWATSITVEEGTADSDTMTLVVTDNTVMGGMYLGAHLTFDFSLDYRFWKDGYFHWRWHSGHWGDWHSFTHSLNFDILPFALNFIRGVADDFPKLKILNDLLPQGIIDHMQDFESGIAQSEGVFINASMPFKWDLIKIGRVVAESGLEVASLGLTPAVATVVTAIVEIAGFLVSLMDTLKVVQVQFGPEVDCEFPLHVTLTDLVAVDANDTEYLYDQLSFSSDFGRTTVTATHTGDNTIPDDAADDFIEKIGMRFRQAIEIPLQTNPGVWAHVGLFWIFALNPSWNFSLFEEVEKHFDVDLGLSHHNAQMTDVLGGEGALGDLGGAPDGVTVSFL